MSEIRWGIIGCGDVCERKSGPAFYKIPDSRLVAVMRRDSVKAADFAKRHNVPQSFDDAEKIIRHPEIDIVYVATPPGTHCDYAIRIAEAGKHCYVEKPMARNAVEARRMVEVFDRRGLKLFVGYYRRTLPVFVRAKQLLDLGAIGKLTAIHHVHFQPSHRRTDGWRVNAEQSGGGLFLDLASHVFDALDYITGAFQQVNGAAMNIASAHEVEDSIVANWKSPLGCMGTSHWCFASDMQREQIELIGTDGVISWSAFGSPVVTLTQNKKVEQFTEASPEHVHQPLVQTIVNQLNGRDECPSTGESALRTQVVLDQCLASYYGGRDDEFWLRPNTWPGRRK